MDGITPQIYYSNKEFETQEGHDHPTSCQATRAPPEQSRSKNLECPDSGQCTVIAVLLGELESGTDRKYNVSVQMQDSK